MPLLFSIARTMVRLADGLRDPATVDAAEMTRARNCVAARMRARGLSPELADRLAGDAQRASVELADAIRAAGKAGAELIAIGNRYAEQMTEPE